MSGTDDPQRHTFTQSYGSTALDAGVLTVGLVGRLGTGQRAVYDDHRRGPP